MNLLYLIRLLACPVALMGGALLSADEGARLSDRGHVAETPLALEERKGGTTVWRYFKQKPEDSPCTSPNAAYFHPLTTPAGVVMTDVAPDDHPHHRGVFVSWLEVRSEAGEGDFWGWGKFAELEQRRIVHQDSTLAQENEEGVVGFSVKNQWKAADTTLLQENLSFSTHVSEQCRVYDLHYRFSADEEVTLGRHAFSGFCVRLRKDLPIRPFDRYGEVGLRAPHHLKPNSNWPDREWYAYEMTLPDGAKAGVAVINHRENPLTTWHNVTRIGMINPCIIGPGPVTIPAVTGMGLRYRIVMFDGPLPVEKLEKLAAGFAE